MFIIVRMKNKQTGAEDRMNQNEKKEMKIRIAKEEDAEALLAIYAPYIEHTVITYEYDVPTVEEFRGRIRHVLERYPYLVAELNGEICGYAYASAFHDRPAGGWNVETSIYVDQNKKGIGIGTALYDKLEKILKRQNILNMNACIACTEIEDEYLTNAVSVIMNIWDIAWSAGLQTVVINSTGGIIWRGWKKRLESTWQISRR